MIGPKYARVATSARTLRCRSAILDGEMIVQDEAGRSDYAALRKSILVASERLVLFAFDLLMLNGVDLRDAPLLDRRKRLQDLIADSMASRIHFSSHVIGNGR